VTTPVDPPAAPTRRYRLYALILLTVINIVNYIERNAIFALFEPIKQDLGLTDTHLGWLGSAYVLVFSLAALPVGLISDLRSRTAMVATGVAAWSVFGSLGGLARGFTSLLVSRAMVGIGGAAANAASTSLVADYFPGARRAAAMAIFTAGLTLGGVLGILLAGQMEALYGWRVTFLALGLPGFGLALLAGRLRDPLRPAPPLGFRDYLRELEVGLSSIVSSCYPLLTSVVIGLLAAVWLDQSFGSDSTLDVAAFATVVTIGLLLNLPRWFRATSAAVERGPRSVAERFTPEPGSAAGELVGAFALVLRTPTLIYIFLGGALVTFGINGIIGWAPTFLGRELGLSVAEGALLLGKWGLVAGVAGTVVGGYLADSLMRVMPSARIVVSSIGYLLGGPLIIWLLTIRDIDLFVPVFVAAFFFIAWHNGPLAAVLFDVVPARIGTTVVGAYLLFIHVAGDAVALPLIGILSDRIGLERAIYVLPIVGIVGGLALLPAVRTVRRDMARVAT